MSQSSGRLMPMRQKALTEASQLPSHCLQTGATSRQLPLPRRHARSPDPSTYRRGSAQHNGPHRSTTGKALPGMNHPGVDAMAWSALENSDREQSWCQDTSSGLAPAFLDRGLDDHVLIESASSISHTNRPGSGVTAFGTHPPVALTCNPSPLSSSLMRISWPPRCLGM